MAKLWNLPQGVAKPLIGWYFGLLEEVNSLRPLAEA
jgi:hypothetical protein